MYAKLACQLFCLEIPNITIPNITGTSIRWVRKDIILVQIKKNWSFKSLGHYDLWGFTKWRCLLLRKKVKFLWKFSAVFCIPPWFPQWYILCSVSTPSREMRCESLSWDCTTSANMVMSQIILQDVLMCSITIEFHQTIQ